MNRTNSITFLLAMVLLLGVSLGCSKITERFKSRSGADPTWSNSALSPDHAATGEKPVLDAEESLNKKASLYITKCVNPFSNRVTDSYSRYASWIADLKAGPTGRERIVYGLYDISGDPEECDNAVGEAAELAPELTETEAIAERYAEALKLVVGEIKGIHDYYEQDNYKDDNFARAKSAHPALLLAFEQFDVVNKEFVAEIDKLEDQVAQNALRALEGDPSNAFQYSVTKFAVSSKKLSVYATRTEFGALDADTLEHTITEVDSDLAEMKTQGSKNPLATVYFSAAEEFVKSSKELMRRVRTKEPFDSFEKQQLGTFSGWMVEGSPDQVRYNYNRLIQSRSMLR